MNSLVFVDTNVLVYRRDASELAKQPRAKSWVDLLWTHRIGRLSVQVLQEFYQTVTRKLSPGLSREDARDEVADLATWRPVPISTELLARAFVVGDAFSISFWDSLIVAAAQQASCSYLLTEDLQDGRDLNGVQILNPFLHEPSEIGL
jgi:predicted nucleic acid-binding protein